MIPRKKSVMKSNVILNLILGLNALLLSPRNLVSIDAVEVGAQVSKYGTDNTLRKRKSNMSQIVPVAMMDIAQSNVILQDNKKILEDKYEDFLTQLDDVDFSVYPEFEGLRESVEYYRNETSKVVDDIMLIFENLEEEKPSIEYEISASSNMKEHSRNQKEETEEEFSQKDNYKNQQEKSRIFHNRARNHAKANGYDHVFDIHDAIQYGDHDYLEKMLSSFNRDMTDAENSVFDNQGRRKLSKINQCEQLKTCADELSLYDLFMFFYSSLVDKYTGELNVNENFVRYDERFLSKKYDDIKALRSKLDNKNIVDNKDNQDTCDKLLSQFHQTIVNGDTPEWHGATVSKVCEAAGTTDYVSLTGIMTGMRNLNDFFDSGTQEYLIKTVDDMVLELLTCSSELFSSDKNLKKHQEKFIFMDDGNYKNSGSLDNAQFPFALDVSTTGCQFVKLPDKLVTSSKTPSVTVKKTSYETCRTTCCKSSWCKTFTCKDTYQGTEGLDKGIKMCDECKFYKDKVAVTSTYSSQADLDNDNDSETYVSGACKWLNLGKKNVGGTYDKDISSVSIKQCQELAVAGGYLSYNFDGSHSSGTCYLSHYIFKATDVKYGGSYTLKTCSIGDPQVRMSSGQLTATDFDKTYLFHKYTALKQVYNNCVAKMIKDETKTEKEAKKCIAKLTKPIDDGMKLVFGSHPSPGFVCGTRDAILNKNKDMPGKCCLDAPFQLEGKSWGHKATCNDVKNDCKTDAPFFANLSEDACAVYGGSYCANMNCEDLRICIENIKNGKIEINGEVESDNDINDGFKSYLTNAPALTSQTTKKKRSCTATREYFGFQGNFIDDSKICKSIWRMRNKKEFAALADNIDKENNNGKGKNSKKPEGWKEGYLDLTPVARDTSQSTAFQNEADWAKANFALQQIVNGIQVVYDLVDNFECPEDFTGILKSICATVKNALLGILLTIIFVSQMIIDISDFQKGQDAELGSPNFAEIYEYTSAVFENMERTGTYLSQKLIKSSETEQGDSDVAAAKRAENLVQESMVKMEKSFKKEVEKMKKNMDKTVEVMGNKMEKMEHNLNKMMQLVENTI